MELVAIPILLLSDYYLTLLANIYKEKKYANHFVLKTYELNPVWQKSVDNNKWLNYRHLLLVSLITTLFYYISATQTKYLYQFLLGFFYTIIGIVNARHLTNLLIFRFLSLNPETVNGQIQLSHLYLLKVSQFQVLSFGIPILFLTILMPNIFILGGLFSCFVFYFIHFLWIKRYKNSLKT